MGYVGQNVDGAGEPRALAHCHHLHELDEVVSVLGLVVEDEFQQATDVFVLASFGGVPLTKVGVEVIYQAGDVDF